MINFDSEAMKRKPNVIADVSALEVMDADSDKGKRTLQDLDYTTWLPFASKTYKISPKIEDYLIIVTPICPSDIPNRNGIGFPLNELTKFQPPPISRMAYKAWAGCPCHYEHKNDVHEDAYGVILDASLHKVSSYGGGKLWKVMGLIGLDKNKYPEMTRRVAEGDVNTYSMGAYVDSFTCSYCNEPMYAAVEPCNKHPSGLPAEHCSHIHPSNEIDWKEFSDYDGSKHIAFRNAHGISPLELSIVESPAWTSALSDHILTR